MWKYRRHRMKRLSASWKRLVDISSVFSNLLIINFEVHIRHKCLRMASLYKWRLRRTYLNVSLLLQQSPTTEPFKILTCINMGFKINYLVLYCCKKDGFQEPDYAFLLKVTAVNYIRVNTRFAFPHKNRDNPTSTASTCTKCLSTFFNRQKKIITRKREYIPQALSLLTLTGFVVLIATGGGVTVGAHRYYTHRAFKATFGLQCWMAGLFTIAGQVRTKIPAWVAAVV